jgi:hypothetical protein
MTAAVTSITSATGSVRHKAGSAAEIDKVLTGTGRDAYLRACQSEHLARANAYREAGALEYKAIKETAKGPLARWGDAARHSRRLIKTWNYMADCEEAAASACVANQKVWREIFGPVGERKKAPYQPDK